MYYLTDAGTYPEPPFEPTNGLVVPQLGAAVVFTGASSGVVTVDVEARPNPPKDLDAGTWDDVVEVSVHVPAGQLKVSAVMSNPPDLPVLTPDGPGHYRVRVHARGRDLAPDEVAFEPSEHYLITVWPAADAPELVHKQTDEYGAGLRLMAG
jgi:hypothetical protein